MKAIVSASRDELAEPHFLDMNWTAVEGELARAAKVRRSGPTAEHLLHAVHSTGNGQSVRLPVL